MSAVRWVRSHGLQIYAVLALLYIFTPIAYVMVFSFNLPARSNLTWRGFTLENWQNPAGHRRSAPRSGTA